MTVGQRAGAESRRTPDRPSPFDKGLEKSLLPGKSKIVAAARELLAW